MRRAWSLTGRDHARRHLHQKISGLGGSSPRHGVRPGRETPPPAAHSSHVAVIRTSAADGLLEGAQGIEAPMLAEPAERSADRSYTIFNHALQLRRAELRRPFTSKNERT